MNSAVTKFDTWSCDATLIGMRAIEGRRFAHHFVQGVCRPILVWFFRQWRLPYCAHRNHDEHAEA
jgi:hypothetical protein